MTSINIRKLSHSEMDLYRKPLLPETWSCFPVDKEIDTQMLRRILQKDLDKIRSGAEKDPFSNSITMLALDISRRLEKNLLNYSALEALIQRLAVGSLGFRADRLKNYMGSVDQDDNKKSIETIIKSLAFNKAKQKKNFSEFNALLQKEIFGIVLTAHPTFGMTFQIMKNLAKLATNNTEDGKKISDNELKLIIKDIFKTEQKPEKNISLDFEHELSIFSLKNLQSSLKSFYKIVLKVSKDLYPDFYHEVSPQIFRLHTWVGYDVDGRGDISWSNTFSKRLRVKLEQLKLYEESLSDIIKFSKKPEITKKLSHLKKLFLDAIKINEKVLKSFSNPEFLSDLIDVKAVSNLLYTNRNKLLTDSNLLVEKINDILETLKKEKFNGTRICDELLILRIEIKNFGLGLGRTQVRLNANQLNNAISKEIDLKGDPNDPSSKRTYLQAISKLIQNVSPVKINFGSLLEENMNARRYFMLIKQMFKYIDQNQSIRFLIAECDYALTVMTALYFAKLFGVDKKIDISPLFETEKGLSSGHEVMNSLLKK